MNGLLRHRSLCQSGFLAVLLLSTLSVRANPLADGDGLITQSSVLAGIAIAILIEALCVRWLLRRQRSPRLFLLWLLGLHLLTYPVFLGLLWLCLGLHPALAATIGEAVIVCLEAGLIYLLCRYVPSAKTALPTPSFRKTLLASLLGNISSILTFPLILFLWSLLSRLLQDSSRD